ncbi:unnamed protein product [Mytilus coruscus]|uniref:Reverse transcriptase RNase H-like domain-containing protein n=1 Tax=Mytilus coruscus TaxID=42192 RepID=A0A6J8EU17_MYTCO|nr:unnamed protein product [Mytilus coruscus]
MFLNELSAKLNTADGDPLDVIGMTTIPLFIGGQLIAHTVIVAGISDSFILDTDASLFGIGAVLSQVQNGEELVISYGSKTLSRAQTKYCTTYRELLAVVTFVKQYRHFLYGRKFLIRTDHSSLIWLKNFKEPEGMVARWISLLDTYDFEIKHRRGAAHGNADALSRQIHVTRHCKRPDCPQCIENTEMTVGAITQKEISSDENNELNNELLRPMESNWLEQWTPPISQKLQMEDETISTVISFLEQNSTKPCIRSQNQELVTLLRQWDQLSLETGLLYRRFYRTDHEVFLQLVAPKSIRIQINLAIA